MEFHDEKQPKSELTQEALAEEQAAIDANTQEEKAACIPVSVQPMKFNKRAIIPYGCTIDHIHSAMKEFVDFIGFINAQLNTKNIRRFESMLMPANFSSMVGEYMTATIPKYCKTLAKNQYHNGHPDLLPKGQFTGDSLQHGTKGSRLRRPVTPEDGRATTPRNVGSWSSCSIVTARPI